MDEGEGVFGGTVPRRVGEADVSEAKQCVIRIWGNAKCSDGSTKDILTSTSGGEYLAR